MTPTPEQVLSALEKACDYDVRTMGCTVQLDEQQLMRFASEMAAAGQQAEREKLEQVAFIDMTKLSNGMAYATAFRATEKQSPLYRIREEQ